MTRTIMPEEMVQAFKPDYIAPLILALCSDVCPDPTGNLYEVGSGWCGRTRWQRAAGHCFPVDKPIQPEDILKYWKDVVDFESEDVDYPETTSDSVSKVMGNLENRSSQV
jgi:multifunctional beta-oxidation protein